jgi:anti-sigma factor (TIGR02949 family)
MKTISFSKGACEKILRYLDSYISGELLVETNHEVLQHLEQCPACSQEMENRVRVRNSLRNAVREEAVPVDLEQKVRRRIHDSQPARLWRMGFSLRWMSAVAALVALSAGAWIALHKQQTQNEYIATLSARLPGILQVGLRDHIHCAVFRKYPKNPPTFAQMAESMGPQYAGLVPLVKEKVSDGYRIILAHRCSFQGRNYIHMVLKGTSALVSLVITKKNSGESLANVQLAPVLQAVGVPLYRGGAEPFQVAGFETPAYLAFLISDLAEENNIQLAATLAPGVHAFLNNL